MLQVLIQYHQPPDKHQNANSTPKRHAQTCPIPSRVFRRLTSQKHIPTQKRCTVPTTDHHRRSDRTLHPIVLHIIRGPDDQVRHLDKSATDDQEQCGIPSTGRAGLSELDGPPNRAKDCAAQGEDGADAQAVAGVCGEDRDSEGGHVDRDGMDLGLGGSVAELTKNGGLEIDI